MKLIALIAALSLSACQHSKPLAAKPVPQAGRYQLHQAYDRIVLLDTATGCVEEVFITPKNLLGLAGSVGFDCESHGTREAM